MSIQPQSAEMDIGAAINNVCAYLHLQGAVFTLYRAWQIEQGFKVTVHQNQPEDCYRAFTLLPEGDRPDCWQVQEVALKEDA